MNTYGEMKAADSPWLGAMPAHWTLSRLRYEAVINGGQVDPRDEPWNGMTLIAPNHVESNTGRIIGIETAEEQGADSGKYLVEPGQLVYSKIRPALNKVAIAKTQALCSADMYAMSFTGRVEPRFALYYFLARPFHTFATVISMRVKMPKVNREELADAPWLVPPLEEQRAIADYLDRETARIDMLIEEQRRLIELLRERRESVITHAVTCGLEPGIPTIDAGVPTLDHVPQHWQIVRIKNVGRALIGLTYAPEDVVDEGDAGSLVLRAGNIQDGRLTLDDNVYVSAEIPADLRLRVGDIVICARNGSPKLIGKNAVATDAVVGQTWGAFMVVLRSPINNYLSWVLNSQIFRSQIGLFSTATISQLTSATLHNLRFALPPAEERKRIGAYLDEQTEKIDALIAESERFVELSRERRSALVTGAVTGQIDVREMA